MGEAIVIVHESPTEAVEEWTQEEFALDVQRAGSQGKLKDAIREAREDYLAGRVKPFPER